jgi:hypothetical protein
LSCKLGDNCIVFENFMASIVDLMLRFGLDWFHCTKICGFIQITGIIGVRVMVFNATFNNFIGGGNWSTRRKPLTCLKSLTNFIT